jgi:hypothetical protein
MIMLVLLGALKPPLCVVAAEELSRRLGPTWAHALEQRLNRPVVLAPACEGESLRVTLDGELVSVVYQPVGHSRTFRLETAEVLSLLAATMVDPRVQAELPDTTPTRAHEHLWLYAGSGAGFGSGIISLALHAGAAYRFEDWALGAELLTLGNPGAATTETSSRIGLGAVAWYGKGSTLRLDGGLGLGFVSVWAPWAAPSGSRYGELMAGLVRLMARLRWAPVTWLGIYARAEANLVVSLGASSGADTFAALQLGAEVML